MLEDAIKEEKEKIAQLDEALSKCGVEVKGDATDSTNPNQQLISQNDLQNLNRTGDSTRTQPN